MGTISKHKRHLIWRLAILLILGLAVFGLCFPDRVSDLPLLREAKVQWHVLRLDHDNLDVQMHAIRTLGEMGPRAKRAVPELVALLDRDSRVNEEDDMRLAAARALGKIGEPAVELLITDLRDASPSVRQQAAENLELMAKVRPEVAENVLQPLITALKDEANRMGLVSSPSALRQVGEPAINPLLRIVLGEDRGQSVLAAAALANIRWDGNDFELSRCVVEPLLTALGNDSPTVREQTAAALGDIVSNDHRHAAIRQSVAASLCGVLHDDSPRARSTAARALGEVLPEGVDAQTTAKGIELLLAALDDPFPDTRLNAAMALGKVVPAADDAELARAAVPPLMSRSEDSNEHYLVRSQAAEALGRIIPVIESPNYVRSVVPPQKAREVQTFAGIEFVWIPAGEFMMGSRLTPDEITQRIKADALNVGQEHPRHRVAISHGFWMAKYELTNAQFRRFRSNHNSRPFLGNSLNGDNQPVVQVSWEDAEAYCRWLSTLNAGYFRLPTEAEWEYACRAGTNTAVPWGDLDQVTAQHANLMDQSVKAEGTVFETMPWNDGYMASAPVGQFKPNPFELHDMIGNVWEWCQDWCGPYPSDFTTDPQGPASGTYRVLRGASYVNLAQTSRAAYRRYGQEPSFKNYIIGFRVVRDAE